MKDNTALTPAKPREEKKPKKKLAARLFALLGRDKKQPLYRRWWMIVLLLLFVPPVGIILLWRGKKRWPLWLKIVLTVLSAVILTWAAIRSAFVTV